MSYKSITSAAAWSTVQERIEEDPHFALSLAKAHVNGHEEIEDRNADGALFDDDLAISGNDLAAALNSELTTDEIEFDDGDIVFRTGLDDDLTDNDAEGDTDSNPDSDADAEMSDANHGAATSDSELMIWRTVESEGEWPIDEREYFNVKDYQGR